MKTLGSGLDSWNKNTLRDALELGRKWKSTDAARDSLMRWLLANYNIRAADIDTISYLKAYKSIFDKQGEKNFDRTDKDGQKIVGAQSNQLFSDVSALFTPTKIIDALGKFAAKRFRQELTIAFLERFRDTLQSDQLKEFCILLPRTYTRSSAPTFLITLNSTSHYTKMHKPIYIICRKEWLT